MYPRACQEGMTVQEVGNSLEVHDHRRNRVDRLTPVLAWLWRRCDGHTPVSILVERVRWEFRLNNPLPVVQAALERLFQRGLVVDADPDRVPAVRPFRLLQFLGVSLGIPALLRAVAWI